MTQHHNPIPYRAPSPEQASVHEQLHQAARLYADAIDLLCPASQEARWARHKLRESLAWAREAVTVHRRPVAIGGVLNDHPPRDQRDVSIKPLSDDAADQVLVDQLRRAIRGEDLTQSTEPGPLPESEMLLAELRDAIVSDPEAGPSPWAHGMLSIVGAVADGREFTLERPTEGRWRITADNGEGGTISGAFSNDDAVARAIRRMIRRDLQPGTYDARALITAQTPADALGKLTGRHPHSETEEDGQ